ncbi:glycoside hydrolase family 88 protein [Phanerochaete carnosa HHB-10118-sp]|uniref:Glycoside hydrolase family 88 protein n=1 Tax=Phanerochaete carnosa (strain HHB-10118-sp) TaxID=650164 RepID=K5VWM2_PHACS|nr:glycoside hydrolase family 88 protein [Phanerochaete carnosa HHB-10118-sp]EKM55948.1 glycoside hydrolase family 88 protein [Phanerochaete carnosa HHB-10118-sp]
MVSKALKSLVLLLAAPCALAADLSLPVELFSPLVAQKILATANTVQNPTKYPQYTDRVQGVWQYFVPDTWTSGFFPATLYELNRRTTLCAADVSAQGLNGTDWVLLGQTWSAGEVPSETNTGVGHDVGFLSFPFVDELQLHPENQSAITAVNDFANHLAGRFDPAVGCTRSWDTPDPTDFEVIIDNMMNLEVLFVSANLTGNHTLIDIATSHADHTAINHVRPDGSSFHVVEYNATTGVVVSKFTAQGYANNSTWSRGQAWGIYGFANMFKHTQNTSYLETSRRMAAYFINNLPDDGVVPWDFNAPLVPPRPADSSAAMIAANGLILLSQGELSLSPPNKTGSDFYVDTAIQIIANNTALAWRPSWQSLLANGTVNNPEANNLTGIVYGDYYFVKNANDLVDLGVATCNGSLTGTLPSAPSSTSSTSSVSSPAATNTGGVQAGAARADAALDMTR